MATRLIEEIVLKVSIDSGETKKQMKEISQSMGNFNNISKSIANSTGVIEKQFRSLGTSIEGLRKIDVDEVGLNLLELGDTLKDIETGSFIKYLGKLNGLFLSLNKSVKSTNSELDKHISKISKANDALKNTNPQVNKNTSGLKDNDNALKNNTSTSKTYTTSLINMKAAFALLSVAGIAKATSSLVSFGKEQLRQDVIIDRYAKRINISTDEFRAYADAAKLFGIDTHEAGQGLKNLTERIADAKLMGTGAAFDALQFLGLDINTLNELGPIEKMLEVATRLNEIDPNERQFLQLELGEEEMFKVQEMMMLGKEGVRDLLAEMKRLNPSLGEIDTAMLREVDFQAGKANLAFKSIFKTLNTKMAPALISLGKLAEEFAVIFRNDVIPTILEFGGVFGEKLVSLAQKALPIIAAIGISSWEVLKLSMMTFADFAVGVFDIMSLAFGETAEDIANPAPWKTIAGFMIGFSKNIKNFIVKPFKQAASFIAEQVGNFQLGWEDLMLGMMGGWKILWGELQLIAFEGIQAILDKLKDVPLLSDKLNINQDLEAVKIAIKDINREITSGQEMINLATDPNQTNPMIELAKELNKEVSEIQGSIVDGFAEGFRIMEDRNGPMAKLGKALENLRKNIGKGPSGIFKDNDKGDDRGLKPLSTSPSTRLDVGSQKAFEFLHKRENTQIKIMRDQLKAQNKMVEALVQKGGLLSIKGVF